MKRKNGLIAGIITSLIALVAMSPAIASGSESVNVDDMLEVLSRPQTSDDLLPDPFSLDILGGVQEATLRQIGSDDAGRYWVGRTSSSVCVIGQLEVDPGMAASSCKPFAEFYRTGVGLIAGTGSDLGDFMEVYIAPDDIEFPDIATSRTREAREAVSFVSGRPNDLLDLGPFEIDRANGIDFQFMRIPHEPGW